MADVGTATGTSTSPRTTPTGIADHCVLARAYTGTGTGTGPRATHTGTAGHRALARAYSGITGGTCAFPAAISTFAWRFRWIRRSWQCSEWTIPLARKCALSANSPDATACQSRSSEFNSSCRRPRTTGCTRHDVARRYYVNVRFPGHLAGAERRRRRWRWRWR